MTNLCTALASGRILLMDGAMGTELLRSGSGDGNLATWNVTRPELVRAVHRAYVEAGAEVLLTNTFQAHALAPGIRESDTSLAAIWEAARDLAREAAGPSCYVLASLGPILGPVTGTEFPDRETVTEVARLARGLDGFLLETCSTPRVEQAVAWLRQALPDESFPLLLSLTYCRAADANPVTLSGHPPEWFAERARSWGVAALGVNCGRDISMDEILTVVRRYRQATDLPLFARPNAGTPTSRDGRWVYPLTPEKMAARLPELFAAGAQMIGGCCGTTPGHCAAFRTLDCIRNKDFCSTSTGKPPE